MFLHTSVATTVEEKIIVLPYLGDLSLALRTRLQNSINKNLPYWKIKVIFKSTAHLDIFFCFEDKIPFNSRSNVVYRFLCGRCSTTYYGKTCWHLCIRVGEHSGISPLTRKKLSTFIAWSKTTIAVKDHMLFCDHVVSLKDFKILASSNSEFFILRSKKGLISVTNLNKIGVKSLCHFTYLINIFLLEYFVLYKVLV